MLIESAGRELVRSVSGIVESDGFVLTVDGARFIAHAITRGEDAKGAYAILAKGETELVAGYRLVVEADPGLAEVDPELATEGPLGCTVSVVKYHEHTIASIDFDPDGMKCGGGATFKTDYPPWAPPPPTKH